MRSAGDRFSSCQAKRSGGAAESASFSMRPAHGPYEARGSIEEWRDGIAQLASSHVLPVLAISAALAGPLLHLAGVEGGGVHFCGQSSKGKTTLLTMAASAWGNGGTPGYVRTWRATANGLEGAAAGATDTVLILDELGQVDGPELASALYALGNGAGKARATRDGALREPRTWRVLTISSGEVPVEAKIAEDRGKRTRAGQSVRMLNIPAARACGVFDHSGPDGDAAAFANRCKLAAASAYGTAGPEFVQRLIAEDVAGADLRTFVKSFVAAELPAGADGQVERAAQRFGIIAAAGEFATAFGLTGWREGEAREAAAWALKRWIDARGGTEPAEVRQAIEAVRHFIEAHGEARFDDLDDPDARPVPNRAGWRKGAGEDRRWLILPEVWKQEGSDARRGLQDHPTVKPTAMLEDALLDLSDRGDIVIDPFLGSGSTLMAAHKTGRVCRGVELDPLYADVIVRRFEAATGIPATLMETGERFMDLAPRREREGFEEHARHAGVDAPERSAEAD
jgi:uncharacterized protein (DUF927 family)